METQDQRVVGKTKDDKAVVAFHQEHLPHSKARETRRAYFTAVLDALEAKIENSLR